MYVWPCRARKYDQNGLTDIFCRFKKGRFFHVCLLLPMQAEEKGPSIHTYISNIHYEGPHTYIHTSTQTNLQLVDSVFAQVFYTTSKLEFHVCLPMPAEEIDTYISKFLNLGISISTARATFFDENVKKMTKT